MEHNIAQMDLLSVQLHSTPKKGEAVCEEPGGEVSQHVLVHSNVTNEVPSNKDMTNQVPATLPLTNPVSDSMGFTEQMTNSTSATSEVQSGVCNKLIHRNSTAISTEPHSEISDLAIKAEVHSISTM